jgi:hypothetical protein
MVKKIQNVELDMEMADGEEAQELSAAKTRLWWNTLRLASKTNIGTFDRATEQNVMGLLEPDPPNYMEEDNLEGGEIALEAE